MCIAVMKPEGKILSRETLEECWNSNPDGAGFMYAEDDKLHIHKGLMSFSAFYRAYKKHQERKSVLHFRIRTHGATDKENTHPFQVGDKLAFVHNGMISKVNILDTKFSDTYHFNTGMLKKLYSADNRFIFKDHYQELIGTYIGWSKLVFLDNKGNHVLVNESAGTWDDEVWYSNTSYKPRPTYKPQQIKPYKEPAKSGDILSIGSRVSIKSHPTLDGGGFITYFGQGSIAVTLDSDRQTHLIHPSYVFPEPKKQTSYAFKLGDFVVRTGSDVFGEITGFVGTSAVVEFYNQRTDQVHSLMCNLSNLQHWEEASL